MRRNVYRHDELELTEIRPGLFGAVFEGDESTLVRWEFPAGQPRTGIHVHDEHEQYGFLLDELTQTGLVTRAEDLDLRAEAQGALQACRAAFPS